MQVCTRTICPRFHFALAQCMNDFYRIPRALHTKPTTTTIRMNTMDKQSQCLSRFLFVRQTFLNRNTTGSIRNFPFSRKLTSIEHVNGVINEYLIESERRTISENPKWHKFAIISCLPFPSFIHRLQVLSLGGNFLSEVPDSVGNLQQLQALTLCDNLIEILPASIARLANLKSLLLHKNRLRHLPRDIITLKNLVEVSGYRKAINQFGPSTDWHILSIFPKLAVTAWESIGGEIRARDFAESAIIIGIVCTRRTHCQHTISTKRSAANDARIFEHGALLRQSKMQRYHRHWNFLWLFKRNTNRIPFCSLFFRRLLRQPHRTH